MSWLSPLIDMTGKPAEKVLECDECHEVIARSHNGTIVIPGGNAFIQSGRGDPYVVCRKCLNNLRPSI